MQYFRNIDSHQRPSDNLSRRLPQSEPLARIYAYGRINFRAQQIVAYQSRDLKPSRVLRQASTTGEYEFGRHLLTNEVQPEANAVLMNQRQRIRIIVADDHTIFRDSLCKMLALESDFEIVGQAANGREVVDLVAGQDPDIVLLDLRMPGLDGLEALRQLRSKKSNAKVIVLTAVDDEDMYVQAVRNGASGVVVKQTATELLIKSIRKVHEGEIWLDSKTTAAVVRAFTAARQVLPFDRRPLRLSNREREISGLVVQGFSNKEIAERLFIGEQTVKNHLHNIFEKLGVSNRLELALYIVQHQGTPT